jgi:hypothetical protein
MKYDEFINNREISLIIWIIVFFIYGMINRDIRLSIWRIVKDLFHKKLIILNSTITLYIVIMIAFYYKIGFWDITAIKDTIFWFIGSSLVLVVKTANAKNLESQFKDAIIDNIKIVAIIEFISNLYSFSLIIELFLVPIICVLSITYYVSSLKKEYIRVTKLLSTILGIIVIILFIHIIVSIFSNINGFFVPKNLRDILLPIVFTITYLPFVYTWILIMRYETFFFRLSAANTDKDLLKFAKRITIIKCNVNLSKIDRLSKIKGFLLMETKDDIIKLIAE